MDGFSKRGGPDIADSPPTVRKHPVPEAESEFDSALRDSIMRTARKKGKQSARVTQVDSSNTTTLAPPEFVRKNFYSSTQPGAVAVHGQAGRHRSNQLGEDDTTLDQDQESGMISDLTSNFTPIIATVVNDSESQPSTLDTIPKITCCTLFRDYRVKLIILVITLIAGGLVAACVVFFLRKNPRAETASPATELPTPAPTGWTAELFLRSILKPNEAWEQPSSPQSQALKYMKNASFDQEPRIPQAYAAHVLRYSILKENGVDISNLEVDSQRHLKGQSSNLFNECSWSIMTCSNKGHITSIKIENTDYKFMLPEELALLTDLNEINLSANKGYGTLPSSFASLNQLQLLILSGNQFSGTIPTQMAEMDSILSFTVNNNQFEGNIPSEFGLTTTLGVFNADWNAITGTLPSEMFANPTLCCVYLSGNRLRGSLPTELGSYSPLTDFHLDENSLTGTIPTEVGNLLSLGELVLLGNELRGTIPSEIGKLSDSLKTLNLVSNKLTGTIPIQLTQLTGLTSLILGENKFSGTLHTEFGRLRHMTDIDLGQNKLNGTIPSELGYLVEMEWNLILTDNALSGFIPSEIGLMTGLQTLNLTGNYGIVGTIPEELGNLESLIMFSAYDNKLSGFVPYELCALKEINLTDISVNCDVNCTCCSNFC